MESSHLFIGSCVDLLACYSNRPELRPLAEVLRSVEHNKEDGSEEVKARPLSRFRFTRDRLSPADMETLVERFLRARLRAS